MRLSIGVYVRLLSLCSNDETNELDILSSLVKSADPSRSYDMRDLQYAQRLIKCKNNLRKPQSMEQTENLIFADIVPIIRRIRYTDIVSDFQKHIVSCIKKSKKQQLLLAFQDIVKKEGAVGKSEFTNCVGMTKETFSTANSLNLPEVLAGLFLYSFEAKVRDGLGCEKEKKNTCAVTDTKNELVKKYNPKKQSENSEYLAAYYAAIEECKNNCVLHLTDRYIDSFNTLANSIIITETASPQESDKTQNDVNSASDIGIRERELAYLHGVIALWKSQLAEKVNVKKDVSLGGIEYENLSDGIETEISDSEIDIGEIQIHSVKMHYQFGSSPKPTDNICECVHNNDGKVVLLGEPGGGKSVALLKIAIEYANKAIDDENSLIPVLLPLGAYKGDETINDFALGFLGELGKCYSPKNFNKRVLKIFDALNETIGDKLDSVISYIKKQGRFIVSCRILDYEEWFSGVKGISTIEILPLDPVRICDAVTDELWRQLDGNEHIISAWEKIIRELSDGEDVFWYYKRDIASSEEAEISREYQRKLEKIELSPNESRAYVHMLKNGVMPLCRNPLMLSIACGLYSNSRLPDTRGKLIKEFVRKSIEDELQKRKTTDIRVTLLIADVLKTSARIIQEKGLGTDTLDINDLIKLCASQESCDVFLAIDIARSAGVLAINVTEKHSVKFYHQLFQEYYASVALQDIVRETNVLDEVFLFNKDKWWESNGWEETVVLFAETASESNFDDFLLWLARFQPLLTVRCIGSNRNFAPKPKTIEKLRSMWLARVSKEVKLSDKKLSIAKTGDALSRIGDKRKGVGKHQTLPDIDWREINALPICVSRHLITVDQFNAFIEDGGYDYSMGFWNDIADFESNVSQIIAKEKATDGLNMPVVGITWFEACAFCNWLCQKTGDKIRLLTSQEWEILFAQCFNTTALKKIPIQIFNVAENRIERLTASGIYSLCELTVAEDLIGNAWEWCGDRVIAADDYDPMVSVDKDMISTRILKGGSWRCSIEYATPSFTLYSFPYCTRSDAGFRIVKSRK